MRRALRRAVGVLLASGVVSLARPALAQTSASFSRGQPPVQAIRYEENLTLTEGHSRLEEMKVQLALLADIATFPYYLGARAAGEDLTVRGYVPNERVKQRALELARQHTFLRVADEMRIQANLSLRPPLRAAGVLQKEGAELLVKDLGEAGRQMRVQARPNGLIVVSGPVESVEEKVAVSRLFRQLGGCSGVINDLTVPTVLRDGQRVIAVTKDGTQMVSPSALGMEPEQALVPPVTPGPIPGTWKAAPLPHKDTGTPAPHQEMETPAPVPPRQPAMLPPPQPTRPLHSLDAHEGELSLPSLPAVKPGSALPPPTKSGAMDNALPEIKNLSSISGEPAPAPMPAVKAKRSAKSWESATPASTTSPKIITITPPDEKLSSAGRDETPKIKKDKPHKSAAFASDSAAPTHSDGSADALTAPTPPMSWRRPGSWESSEAPAKVTPPAMPTPVAPKPAAAPTAPANSATGVSGASFERSPAPLPAAAPATPTTPIATPATPTVPAAPATRAARRWPPAYEVKPPEAEAGHAGTIEFEEEPPATPLTTTQHIAISVGTEDLKKQVKTVCGRQAKDVTAAVQPDGSVLVTVKVAKAAQKQVTARILSIPEMRSPKVRLKLDVVP